MHKAFTFFGFACLILTCGGCSCSSDSGDRSGAGPKIKGDHVPDSTFAAIVIHPRRATKSQTLEPLKLDSLIDEVGDEMPVDVRKVEQVIILFASGEDGDLDEDPSVIFRLGSGLDKKQILATEPFSDLREFEFKGQKYLARDEEDWADCWAFPDDQTMLFAEDSDGIKAMLSSTGSSPLIEVLSAIDTNCDAFAAVTLDPIRPMIQAGLSQGGDDVPPLFLDLPSQIDTITATATLDPSPRVEVVVKATDAEHAADIERAITVGVGMASLGLGELRREAERELGPELARKLVSALEELTRSVKPQVLGDEVRVSVNAPAGTDELINAFGKVLEEEMQSSRERAARVQISMLRSAIEVYTLELDAPPASLDDLTTPPDDPDLATKWRNGGGPFLFEPTPADPWGNPFEYRTNEDSRDGYELWSKGPDGLSGTSDDIHSR